MGRQKTEQAFVAVETPAPVAPRPGGRDTYDERLNRILEAATAVIARDGYQKASMRAVSGAAGVSLAANVNDVRSHLAKVYKQCRGDDAFDDADD